MHRADKLEEKIWRFVCTLLTDPDRLRADLDTMIEEERRAERGDPEREAKVWLEKLAKVEEERRGYQRLAVKGYMTDEELEGALAELEETRKVAERELSSLRGRRQRVEQMERDRDTLLENYARMAPEALDELSPEERHQIYRMLGLRASIRIDGTLEVEGTLVEGAEFCSLEVQYSMQ